MLEYILNYFKKSVTSTEKFQEVKQEQETLFHLKDDNLSALDDLFKRSVDYKNSKNYLEALDFIIKISNQAPYNAWLLKEQNKDISYVASAYEWKKEFNRDIRVKARAYVILKAFGPVSFVYDVKDTIGSDLPIDIEHYFRADGILSTDIVKSVLKCCHKKGISVKYDSALSERQAGWASHNKLKEEKSIVINAEHSAEIQFSTLCHELAHLMLGHLGEFQNCQCKNPYRPLSEAVEEVEAESVSWLVCKRLQIETNADSYLSTYFSKDEEEKILNDISIDNILTTAGRIESMILKDICTIKKTKKAT